MLVEPADHDMSSSPSQKELEQLPLWAIVAFAERCASRVLPVYYGHMGGEELADVEIAIQVSERSAAGDEITQFAPAKAAPESSAANAATAARAAAMAAWAAAMAAKAAVANTAGASSSARVAENATAVAIDAAVAADDAAHDAKAADDAADDARATRAAMAAAMAAVAAINAAWSAINAAMVATNDSTDVATKVASAHDADVADAARADFSHLLTLKLGEPLELGSPIDTSENGPLGPLWPEGLPASLRVYLDAVGPAESSRAEREGLEPQRLVLEAEVDEFADTEEVASALANLCYALNAYHIAAGGNGLAIDEWQILVPKSIPAGAR